MCGRGAVVLPGICSPVSPGRGYVNDGPCFDPNGFANEACLCWRSSWMYETAQPYYNDANPEPLDANP